jgi:hypothetical protein
MKGNVHAKATRSSSQLGECLGPAVGHKVPRALGNRALTEKSGPPGDATAVAVGNDRSALWATGSVPVTQKGYS